MTLLFCCWNGCFPFNLMDVKVDQTLLIHLPESGKADGPSCLLILNWLACFPLLAANCSFDLKVQHSLSWHLPESPCHGSWKYSPKSCLSKSVSILLWSQLAQFILCNSMNQKPNPGKSLVLKCPVPLVQFYFLKQPCLSNSVQPQLGTFIGLKCVK